MIKIKFLFPLPFVIPTEKKKNFTFQLKIEDKEYKFNLNNNYWIFYIPNKNIRGLNQKRFYVEKNKLKKEFIDMKFIDKKNIKAIDICQSFYNTNCSSIIEYIINIPINKLQNNKAIMKYYHSEIDKEYNKYFIDGFNYFINCYRELIPVKHKWVVENLRGWNFGSYTSKLYKNNKLINSTPWINNISPISARNIFYHTKKIKTNEILKLKKIISKNKKIRKEKNLINNAYSILQRGFYKTALIDSFTAVEIVINKIIDKINYQLFKNINLNYNKTLYKELGRQNLKIKAKINVIFEYYNNKKKYINLVLNNEEIIRRFIQVIKLRDKLVHGILTDITYKQSFNAIEKANDMLNVLLELIRSD